MADTSRDDRSEGRRCGRARRDAAHLTLLARRGRYVRLAQAALLAAIAENGQATADDIRQRLTLPADINPTLIGPAVRQLRLAGAIRRVGRDTESCRPVAHARPLPIWTTTSGDAGPQWLSDHPAPIDLPPTVTPPVSESPAPSITEPAPILVVESSPPPTQRTLWRDATDGEGPHHVA